MVRFLAKVVLTIEPTVELDKYHDEIREITAHHKKNLLNLIGVDPVVYRAESSEGEVDLQIWITTITSHPLNKIIIPFYYLGSRKYIFLCTTKNGYNFVKEIIDLAKGNLNALYEFAILTPVTMKKKVYNKLKANLRDYFIENNLEKFSFHQIEKPADYQEILDNFTEDIVINRPRPGDKIPIGYNLGTVEEIAKSQGFTVDENHQVTTQIDDIKFIVDLKYNNVFAEISTCEECEEDCTVRRKLCIVIAIPGYASISGLGDYRMLSVLVAIKDGSILSLKGEKPEENISNQLDALRKEFKKKCKKISGKKE